MPQLVSRFSNFAKNFTEEPSQKPFQIKPIYGASAQTRPRRKVSFDIPEDKPRRRSTSNIGRASFGLGAGMGGKLVERLRMRD